MAFLKAAIALALGLAGCATNQPLNDAASRNDVTRIKQLAAAGENLNALGGHGITPLAAAARVGSVAAIAVLISNGADPDLGSGVNGWTPLQHAIHKRRAASVEALLRAGASVNARDSFGKQTPLSMASRDGVTEIVRILMAHGTQK